MKKKSSKRVVATLLVACMTLAVCPISAMAADVTEPTGKIITPKADNEEHVVAYNEFGFAEDGTYQPAVKAWDGVYEISNVGQLYWFAQQVNSGNTDINGRIMADLDMSVTDIAWTPIGLGEALAYTGWFDGGLFKITNMKGMLFGTTDGAFLEKIAIESGVFYENGIAAKATGSIAGVMINGYLGQSYSKATISEFFSTNVGGLVGAAFAGRMEHCFYAGSICVKWTYMRGSILAGGLVGNAAELDIVSCFVNATINSERVKIDEWFDQYLEDYYRMEPWMCDIPCIGGLVGDDNFSTEIKNSYYNCDLCSYEVTGNNMHFGIGIEPDPTFARETEFFTNGDLLNALTGGETDGLQVWCQDVEGGEAYPHLVTIGVWTEDNHDTRDDDVEDPYLMTSDWETDDDDDDWWDSDDLPPYTID